MNASSLRQINDVLGNRTIPAAVYWGVHRARTVENSPISGQPLSCMPELVHALAFVEKATQASTRHGALGAQSAGFIAAACDDLIAGRLREQFVADVIQGGAGSSTNMNADGVHTNRAANAEIAQPLGVISADDVQAVLVPAKLTRDS